MGFLKIARRAVISFHFASFYRVAALMEVSGKASDKNLPSVYFTPSISEIQAQRASVSDTSLLPHIQTDRCKFLHKGLCSDQWSPKKHHRFLAVFTWVISTISFTKLCDFRR